MAFGIGDILRPKSDPDNPQPYDHILYVVGDASALYYHLEPLEKVKSHRAYPQTATNVESHYDLVGHISPETAEWLIRRFEPVVV